MTALSPQINKEIPMNTVRRVSYVFLCMVPFLSFVVGGVRAFRVPGVYQAVGVAYFAAIAVAAIMLSGPLYLIWNTYAFGVFFAKEHAGEVPQALHSLGDTFDLLLFVAGFLTYLATVAFAASLGRVQWLGRRATRAFMIVNGVALLFLVIRGLHYPDPRALSTPWYTSPGFVVGIPAVPFIMPFLFGVVLLRRAGDEQSQEGPNQSLKPTAGCREVHF